MIETRQVIRKGSKSFFLASLFFDEKTKNSCWDLYQWCRHCDDQVDNTTNPEEAGLAIQDLMTQWNDTNLASPPFQLVHRLKDDFKIPESYFLDLLHGFKMDVEFKPFRTIEELEKYAYHVAGVVGLKMSYIMGVSDEKALKHAVDLGIAMQLTNIVRDIKEDYLRGRVYLPESWLREAGVSYDTILHESSKPKVYAVVQRLLDHADQFYTSGYKGLKYLPLRSTFAVSIAGSVYSRIGRKIRRLKESSLEGRTVVGIAEKCLCIGQGLLRVLPIIVGRAFRPWSRFEFQTLKETP